MKVELKPAPNKNAGGQLGPVCGNCGGYGFTLSIANQGSQGCHACGQTGIARMDTAQLTDLVNKMYAELQGLKNIILKELGNKNV